MHIQILKIALSPDSNTSTFLKPSFILDYTWHLFVSTGSLCTFRLSLGINDSGAFKRVIWILQTSSYPTRTILAERTTKFFHWHFLQFEKVNWKHAITEPILQEFLTSLALTLLEVQDKRQQPKYNVFVTIYPFITYLRVAA